MNEKLGKYILFILLSMACITGLYAMVQFLSVNHIRSDEFLSFMHSQVSTHKSSTQIIKNIHQGADNSYVHAVLLYQWFSVFGETVFAQRLLSFVFWLIGGFFLWKLFATQSKSTSQKLLFWSLIQFSNLGFWMANDGRFYSIHYALSLCLFYVLIQYVNSKKSTYLILMFGLTLMAFLNAALSIVSVLLLVFVCGMMWAKKYVNTRQFLLSALSVLLPTLMYFLCFKIQHFHHHFSTWMFSKSTSDGMLLQDFISTPFRFIAIFKIPFLNDQIGVVLTIVLLVAMVLFNNNKKHTPGFNPWNVLACAVSLLLIGQLLAYVIMGWPLWPYRYYAGIFWILPFWLYQRVDCSHHKITSYLAVFISIGFGTRMMSEVGKIAVRKNEIPVAATTKTGYVEYFENYKTFAKLGEQYIRYPEVRGRLFLVLDDLSTERNGYFSLLKKQGEPLQTISPHEVDSTFILIKD
jgi:hypothetical protein